MKTLANKFIIKHNELSIYGIYHSLVELGTVHKMVSQNGVINFIFQDGSVIQTDTSLHYIEALKREYLR